MGGANAHRLAREGTSIDIVVVGVDLAKIVFADHGIDDVGGTERVMT